VVLLALEDPPPEQSEELGDKAELVVHQRQVGEEVEQREEWVELQLALRREALVGWQEQEVRKPKSENPNTHPYLEIYF